MLRAAERLHDWLSCRNSSSESIHLPELSWTHLRKLERQIDAARRRGWHRAAAQLRERLICQLLRFGQRLFDLSASLHSGAQRQLPKSTELFRQIKDLQTEFGDVSCQLQEGQLRVATESIDLEGVSLGSFEIRLDWRQPRARRTYQVVAMDPNPSCSNSAVTHPHVQNDELCEGDGIEAIRAALDEGRIYDFFLIVSRVLETYCPDSAYAPLDTWYGLPCTDCGAAVHEDYRTYCGSCDDPVCDGCIGSCEGCSGGLCSSCTSSCKECHQPYCRACLEECSGCQADVCGACLDERLCRQCRQDQENEEPDEAPNETPENENTSRLCECADAPVQPNRLGEITIPA